MTGVEARHIKQLAMMRGWLEGAKFYAALEALELVQGLEKGTRKDGKTPKFHHQLSVARLLTTLSKEFMHTEDTITVAFFHDVLEDHSGLWSVEKLADRFGHRVAHAVWAISKKTDTVVKDYSVYFAEMTADPIASLVKLADRAHNLQTMQGVFTYEKQAAYVAEVERWFYPMIKQARRNFPRQYPAYENLKIILRIQCNLIQHIHEVTERVKDGL